MKKRIQLFLVTLLIVCLELSQNAQAVTPAPDGGYPGGNTAEGDNALLSLSQNGTYNTAVGFLSLRGNTNGNFNTAIGAGALFSSTNAAENTATGTGALLNTAAPFVSGGNRNTADGAFALLYNTTGSSNTAIGDRALINSGFIGNIWGASVGSGVPVYINSSGRLGAPGSSRRFKEDIKPIGKASEAILALKPVTFRYKKDLDGAGTPQFGLVAEDVEKVNPDLVVRDKEGKPYTVRYDQVNAMLLNEFLKEHRKVQELEATISQLKSNMAKQEATIAQQQKG